ncbi:GLIPR1-like protein 1 isoform X2 [Tubulanus polymorphus]|uniref:GLIPR1-like protein 1 isoform X2 n=1 Tax=Tubulanus polymorphus TaxID=672921 RepID=UPI003DA6471F
MKFEGTCLCRRGYWIRNLFIVSVIIASTNVISSLGQREMRASQKRNIVDLHNFYRRLTANTAQAADMKKIFWDESLAESAQKVVQCRNLWKSHQQLSDEFGEMDEFTYFLKYGVNTAKVPRKTTMSSIIRKWFNEGVNYDEMINQCTTDSPCWNYSQLITAETDRVGCAVNKCTLYGRATIKFVACMYYPAVSVGEKPFKSGEPCSKCASPAAFCHKQLCVPCLESDSGLCECRKTCKLNEFGRGILDRSTCTCKCEYGSGNNCDEPCFQEYDDELCEGQDCTNDMIQEMCPMKCSTCRSFS